MSHGLDAKDADEIKARAAKLLAARMTLNRGKQRKALTMRQMAEVLGDTDGMSCTSRIQDAAQRRKGGDR